MESIIQNIKDPSWWFSTVLVAIIASVVAGFLKDRISQLIGHLSNRLKEWSQKRKQKQEELIETLSNNPTYLLIGYGKVIFLAVMFVGTIVIYLITPIHAELQQEGSNPGLHNAIKLIASIIVYPFLGGLCMAYGYKVTSSFTVIAKATKRYREKNGLPKLP